MFQNQGGLGLGDRYVQVLRNCLQRPRINANPGPITRMICIIMA